MGQSYINPDLALDSNCTGRYRKTQLRDEISEAGETIFEKG